MAIDSRVLLGAQPVDVGASFGNALLNVQRAQQIQEQKKQAELNEQLQPLRNRLLDAQVTTAEQGVLTPEQIAQQRASASQEAMINNLGGVSRQALAAIELGGPNAAGTVLERAITQFSGTPSESELMDMLQMSRENPEQFAKGLQSMVDMQQQQAGGASNVKAFAPVPNQEGGLSIPVINTDTQQTEFRPIEGSVAPPTKTSEAQSLADIDVEKARRVAEVKQRATRTSEMRKDFTTRLADATRAQFKIDGAIKLAEVATQGVPGVLKLQAAKLFPSIDVTNEAQLNQAFLDLAVENLQRIKGPTTDFEFGKMEEITGTIGDSKVANIARLKSNQRQVWFARREAQQFNKFIKSGGDPDLFSFNFNEEVQTKHGPKRLVDIRDTAAHFNLTVDEVLAKWGRK